MRRLLIFTALFSALGSVAIEEGACRIGAPPEECESKDKTLVDKNAKLQLPPPEEERSPAQRKDKKKLKISRDQGVPRP